MIMDYIDQNYYSPDVYAHNVAEHPEQFGIQPCYGKCQITENLKHELAIYKEALWMACRETRMWEDSAKNLMDEYLQKVRER